MGDKQDEGLLLGKKERDRIIKAHALSALPSIRTAVECACKAQLAKVLKHKLDRPELREQVVRILSPGMLRSGDALNGKGELVEEDSYLFITKEYKGRIADQILALIPDIEKALEKQHKSLVRHYNIAMKVAVEEAKREERERIRDLLPENPWENNNRGCNPDKRVAINKILDKIRQILRGE